MFQFVKKAQANTQEAQDLTEEQLLQISGGTGTALHPNHGKHLAKGHSKQTHWQKQSSKAIASN